MLTIIMTMVTQQLPSCRSFTHRIAHENEHIVGKFGNLRFELVFFPTTGFLNTEFSPRCCVSWLFVATFVRLDADQAWDGKPKKWTFVFTYADMPRYTAEMLQIFPCLGLFWALLSFDRCF